MLTLAAETAQEMWTVSEMIGAEALFASTLQPSDSPSGEQVRAAVTATLRRLGARNCAAVLAGEFGEHPDCAATRMTWARETIRRVYSTLDEAR